MVVDASKVQPHVEQVMRVGIDMAPFMDECVAGTYSVGIHHPFAGGPLRILFFRLAHLLKISANFVFVFDSPNKPEKRGRAVNSQPQLWWVDDAQRLIESFGFYTHEAPGEAEAELALLNRWGMIDALWTSDSDSVVFGGHTILRTIPSKERATGRLDELKLYTTEDVHQKLGLDRGQLLLYSLVAGGDYGNGLRAPFSTGDINATALDAWRHQTLEILSSNSAADIGLSSRTKNMFLKQIDSFPSIEVLQNYLHPSTSFSHPSYLPDADNWCSIQQPDVARIVGICRQRLGWSRNSSKLRGVLRNNVWEGVIIRLILSGRCVWDKDTSSFGTPSCRLQVKSCRTSATKALNPAEKEECIRLGVHEEDLYVETLPEEHRRFLELPLTPLSDAKPVVVRAWLAPCVVPEWLLESQHGGIKKGGEPRGKKRVRKLQGKAGTVKKKSRGKEREKDSPVLLTELISFCGKASNPAPSVVTAGPMAFPEPAAGTSSSAGASILTGAGDSYQAASTSSSSNPTTSSGSLSVAANGIEGVVEVVSADGGELDDGVIDLTSPAAAPSSAVIDLTLDDG
ncbi:PIN domain-like protein [Ephemerocybe angulata]|uniref:PIN domain-like protein n=1 Tax=Ephemerocybe angulata TaxID=980116 RepID=A0A8H6HM58_9AGAR|nr:PIN domain-like protein [Tulosesus angulatus]